MFNKQIPHRKHSPFEGGKGDVKKIPILNPYYQNVKKNMKKKNKKRIKKPCGNKKDFYFCTRIRAEVHTQTGVLNKSKKLLKKVKKRFG
ncbi:hypothetical protein [Flavobacterium cyclinae]|uniref:hypothetical protein n=1 Tax=Flavobacterium cyclinae TaxID=2895947 RepID=UPI001E42B7B7|nr:hypothetical protein [Flavobacterium cyclinae]UGS20721.1 hypothetical protein LOS86_11975 [Flavobacterium cyclinae]